MTTTPYTPKHKIKIVTAASLFDGHDASINIMRKIIQSSGVEVVHLGHDRSVQEVVDTAIQEDAHAIAMTSYQGGHLEYFKYMYDMLQEKGAGDIRVFGGGGGVILPEEIKELEDYGIERIYSPDDGRELGLQGMINDLIERSDYPKGQNFEVDLRSVQSADMLHLARLISVAENKPEAFETTYATWVTKEKKNTPILGITGTGGAGKSSVVDELVRRMTTQNPDLKLAILSVDPSKKKTGGALLGDRIRMNSIYTPQVYMRSLATRQSNLALSKHVGKALDILQTSSFDCIILETSGIGQSDTEILDHSSVSLYVMTPEFGAATQLEKIDMLDFADFVAINKFDKRGALDALRDVRKQYLRNHNLWDKKSEDMPVYGTIASQFNDHGVNTLYQAILERLNTESPSSILAANHASIQKEGEKQFVIPPSRVRYLSEIAEQNRTYNATVKQQSSIAESCFAVLTTMATILETESAKLFEFLHPDGLSLPWASLEVKEEDKDILQYLERLFQERRRHLQHDNWMAILEWPELKKRYTDPVFTFQVRKKTIEIPTHTESLSHSKIPKIALPKYTSWGDILRWTKQENVPGGFPYTSGLYPFKREGEDPTRMFAGEGAPERTNRRFHYVSKGMPAKRLSTAFDSITLYGRDPHLRPDIYGKIGNAGVSVCCLDDAKKLYSGFDLTHALTSVSMTINGPAPMLLAFFLNAAIDQQCEKYIVEHGLESTVEKVKKAKYKHTNAPEYHGPLPEGNDGLGLMLLGLSGDEVLPAEVYQKIKVETLKVVRGTVQADILKEDQAQNTCIFSTEFALRLMGDVQEYFIEQAVRNFYSVSISGYHIAEAGANPITQLAFTLSNGFTYVEYYLSRGMSIDDFGPNLSFFFSNGVDPEYAVIGRVARKIWAKAMKEKYGAGARAQMLKYHIQTSGRSLHAQEIDFNDIRTTLQALYAIYDNCNSLHTNAYDEAITTPTEESVRRAMAIQLIINKELGLAKNENPLQGAFIIEELTDLVEEAVLLEFDKITERGGVLGAMETTYQRSQIQEESLYYETLKHTGEFPIVGVNTFLSSKGSPTVRPGEVIRATEEEKQHQIDTVSELYATHKAVSSEKLSALQTAAIENENLFQHLMEVVKFCSLGQITESLFQVGGQYRRNM